MRMNIPLAFPMTMGWPRLEGKGATGNVAVPAVISAKAAPDMRDLPYRGPAPAMI
jgi:hypothetical protein